MKLPHSLSILTLCLVSSSLFAATFNVTNDTPYKTTLTSSNGLSQSLAPSGSFNVERSSERSNTIMQQNNQWRISTPVMQMQCNFSLPQSYPATASGKIQIYRGFLVISTTRADLIKKCTAIAS